MAHLLARRKRVLVVIQELVVMLQMIMAACLLCSYVYLSYAPAYENESAPSKSSHLKKKRRTNDKTFDNMCSNIGALSKSISALISKLDELISVLSTIDKELSNLQVKLFDEMRKIDGLSEKEILDAIDIIATKHDMLHVFFNLSNELKKRYILRMIGHDS